jgi:carbon monoxide dehydrogenase subunit G
MSLSLNETFRVAADPDRVWRFLKSPADVVTCLPGAELVDIIDPQTYAGKVKVKVGPITAAYSGRAILTQVDDAARRMQIVAEGKETGGPGSAKMTMTGLVTPLPGGGAEVSVDAQIDIAGRVMQFGRGLIESVNKQLFAQFAEAVQVKLLAAEAAGTVPLPPTSAANPAADASARDDATTPQPTGGVPELTVTREGIVYTSEFTGTDNPVAARGKQLSAFAVFRAMLVGFLKGLFGGKK